VEAAPNMQSRLTEKPSIIFSDWKRTISTVGSLFQANGVQCRRIDGDISIPERRQILSEFGTEPSCRVLLMTLGTGGLG
jgi:SWI/SNF-related matrix-associated actin-dependent regulator of chromatin subfamily A3